MASSNIKLFDENKGNMLSDTEFSTSNQRMNGVQAGVASSKLQNKAMYQVSLVAYAIAQVMMQNGKNANDTDAVSAFVANLSGTMLQKVYDIATTAEAQAGVATGKWMSPALVKAAIDTLAAKAQNILSNNTKALYGLSSDAVPDDVLSMLSRFQNGLGNEYVWEKVQYAEELSEVPGVIIYGNYYVFLCSTQGGSSSCQYSEKIAFDESGSAYLVDPVTATVASLISNPAVLKGKYFLNPSPVSNEGWATALVKIAENASVSAHNDIAVKVLQGGAFYVSRSKSSVAYVNSPDPSAYPPAVSDGCTYTLLGQLGNKVQIATGSYTGTGTYGSGSKNSLTFNFEPKILFIAGNGGFYYALLVSGVTTDFYYYSSGNTTPSTNNNYGSKGSASISGNTVSWYGSDVTSQANNATTFYYVAIG